MVNKGLDRERFTEKINVFQVRGETSSTFETVEEQSSEWKSRISREEYNHTKRLLLNLVAETLASIMICTCVVIL